MQPGDIAMPEQGNESEILRNATFHRRGRLAQTMAIAAMLATVGVLTTISSALASEVPDGVGPWKVGHTAHLAIDTARANRELPLDIWYPVDEADWIGTESVYPLAGPIGITSEASIDDVTAINIGELPLIVFSHGFGGINTQSFRLMEHLASHGFVVVSPEHTGNTQTDPSSPDPEADRYPDIAFVIDEMEVLNTNVGGPLEARINTDNVGVAGHSFGGMTAQFMAAGHAPFGPDLRVKAIMPIAASSNQLTDPELTSITIPTMLMVGTFDGLHDETVRSFNLISSAPFLYRADVVTANHTHFANVCAIGDLLISLGITIDQWPDIGAAALIPIYEATCVPPAFPIAEAERIQNLYAAAHFRRHLLGETFYDRYLVPAYAAGSEPDVEFYGGIKATVDPFVCYKSKTTPGTTPVALANVELSDAFAPGTYEPKKLKTLCTPGDEAGGEIDDPNTHLKAYQIKGLKHAPIRSIAVTDRFGSLTLDAKKIDQLLGPALTELGMPAVPPVGALDSFACYKIKTSSKTPRFAKGVQATVSDRFEDRTYDLKKPERLCVAVDRNGGGLLNPADAMICYKAKRAKDQPKHTAVKALIHTADDFGSDQIDTQTEASFCVPASLGP